MHASFTQLLPQARLATVAIALLFIAPVLMADPLHRVAGTASWRHEFSGWVFAARVADFQRVGEPWQIDGGDDVGARYEIPGAGGTQLVLEVHTGMRPQIPDGAAVFALPQAPGVRGSRMVRTDDNQATVRYAFDWQDWSVVIVATARTAQRLEALDTLVRALPWETLGGSERLH